MPPPYTETLLPVTYVNDPAGEDFQIDNGFWHYANTDPAGAVAAMVSNDSAIPPASVAGDTWGRHDFFMVVDRGNGRFTMTDPAINGVVSQVACRLLIYETFNPDWYHRIWTYGVMYEQHFGTYIGQSTYPPGVGWEIWEYVWALNPNTGLAWTLAEVTAMDAGFRLYAAPLHYITCDQIYLLITYSLVPPTGVTSPATNVQLASATINGTVIDDGGEVCTLSFEWGPTVGLGNTLAAGTGSTGNSFSGNISGLAPGQNYYFRAVVTNSRGTSYGTTLSLTSASSGSAACTVDALPATSVTASGATLNGMVANSLGRYGEVRFEYGLTTAYGNTTPWQQGFYTGDLFEHRLTDLHEGIVYHFRAQFRGSPTVSSADMAFATLAQTGGYAWVEDETLRRIEGF